MMTPDALSRLHARAYGTQGRAWTAEEFATLLADRHTCLVADAQGFAIGRVIAGEGELLMIVTDPDHRRRGLGRALLAEFCDDARSHGAERIFLEVAEDNNAAVALYTSAGFCEVARRKGYYPAADGTRQDALIFELGPASPG